MGGGRRGGEHTSELVLEEESSISVSAGCGACLPHCRSLRAATASVSSCTHSRPSHQLPWLGLASKAGFRV